MPLLEFNYCDILYGTPQLEDAQFDIFFIMIIFGHL